MSFAVLNTAPCDAAGGDDGSEIWLGSGQLSVTLWFLKESRSAAPLLSRSDDVPKLSWKRKQEKRAERTRLTELTA